MPKIERPPCGLFNEQRWQEATRARVDYSNYLESPRRDFKFRIVKGWLDKATSLPDEDSIEAFFYVWVSFNAWGKVVVRTNNDRDRVMVDALAAERGLDAAFALRMEDPAYSREVGFFCTVADPRSATSRRIGAKVLECL
jgi:hypothetical protein